MESVPHWGYHKGIPVGMNSTKGMKADWAKVEDTHPWAKHHHHATMHWLSNAPVLHWLTRAVQIT